MSIDSKGYRYSICGCVCVYIYTCNYFCMSEYVYINKWTSLSFYVPTPECNSFEKYASSTHVHSS